MRNDEFDRLMKQALEEKAQGVEASPFLLQKIKRDVKQEREKERFSMKRFHMKKLAVAAVICLASVTCYGAVRFGNIEIGTNNDIHKISELEDAKKEVGLDAKYVETFRNGFAFRDGGTGAMQMDDAEPSGVLKIGYENEDGKHVSLLVEDAAPFADAGITEGYSSQLYKFVPPDYELTEEDKERKAAGELEISYGSKEVEEQTMENYSWQDDGLRYSLTAADCDFGEAEMAQMAAEIKG